MFTFSKKTVLVTTAAFALGGGAMAYAWFGGAKDTTGRTGKVYLTVKTIESVPELPPNGDEVEFEVVFHNSATETKQVRDMWAGIVKPDGGAWTFKPAVGEEGADLPVCSEADIDVWTEDAPPSVDPGADSAPVTFKAQLHERPWDQSNCLGLSNVPIHVTVS